MTTGRGQEEFRQIETALNKEVNVNIANASRLAAIREICKEIQLEPVFSTTALFLNTKVITENLPYPSTVAGPFLLQVTKCSPVPTSPTKYRVNLKITAIELPLPALARVRKAADPKTPPTPDRFEIDITPTIPNGDTANITATDKQTVHASNTAFVMFAAYEVDLPVSANEMELVGQIKFTLPTEMEWLRFEQPKRNDSVSRKGIELKITKWKNLGGSMNADVVGRGFLPHRASLLAYDNRSKIIPHHWQKKLPLNEAGVSLRQHYHKMIPHSIAVGVITEATPITLDFQIKGIEIIR